MPVLDRFNPQRLPALANFLALLNALGVLFVLGSQVVKLLKRGSFFAAKTSLAGERDDPLRDDRKLSLPPLHVVAAVFDFRFQLGKPLALAGHGSKIGRRYVFRQTQRPEPGL